MTIKVFVDGMDFVLPWGRQQEVGERQFYFGQVRVFDVHHSDFVFAGVWQLVGWNDDQRVPLAAITVVVGSEDRIQDIFERPIREFASPGSLLQRIAVVAEVDIPSLLNGQEPVGKRSVAQLQ